MSAICRHKGSWAVVCDYVIHFERSNGVTSIDIKIVHFDNSSVS